MATVLRVEKPYSASKPFSRPWPEAANVAGNVQGGIVVAMLDNAMGYNSFFSQGMANQQASIDIHTHFFNPVPMGRVEVDAKVVKTGR